MGFLAHPSFKLIILVHVSADLFTSMLCMITGVNLSLFLVQFLLFKEWLFSYIFLSLFLSTWSGRKKYIVILIERHLLNVSNNSSISLKGNPNRPFLRQKKKRMSICQRQWGLFLFCFNILLEVSKVIIFLRLLLLYILLSSF